MRDERGGAMSDLKFGVFDHLDRGRRSIAQLYDERLQIVEQYERAGFYAYHLAEHHSTPLGMAPSPSLFLVAVAQRTKVLRFGPLVYLLPLYHPIRLSEEIAMLDQLSNGRLDVGVGRGRSPIEVMLYGRDAAEGQAVYNETLEILHLAFREERISYTGKHFQFRDVPVELRCVQQPHPPLWYGVGTPESAAELGSTGFNAVTLAKPGPAAAIARAFYEASSAAGFKDRRMGICRFVVVGDTDREAEALAERAYPIWHESFFELFRRFNQKPVQVWSGDFKVMMGDGLAVAGSPETVARRLGEQLRSTGANYLVSQIVFGDMSLAESTKSIGLYAAKVMPALLQAHQTGKLADAATGRGA
jgi:alkanesulfonate monooxygenase SsuD/methylene tetrahydromethanopterin reductase-like flavin-dependent oxidoreductase (luciferase family)